MDNILINRVLPRAVQMLAMARLEAATEACGRLRDPDDAAALHDFRVALRRLRSLLRAYHPWLRDALPRKYIRRLGKLARRTGSARDAEVQIPWLRDQLAHADDAESMGVQWLLDDREAVRERAYRWLRDQLPADYARLRKRLASRLSGMKAVAGPTFGTVAARRLRAGTADFQARMDAVHGLDDPTRIHAARIACKRLRYLLEPLVGELDAVKALVTTLRALQDLMGGIHDHQVMGDTLLRAAEAAGAVRQRSLVASRLQAEDGAVEADVAPVGDVMPGFLLLAQRLQQERRQLTLNLLGRIEAGEVKRLTGDLQGICGRLGGAAAGG